MPKFQNEYQHQQWLNKLVTYAKTQRIKSQNHLKDFKNQRIHMGNCHFGIFSTNGEYDYLVDVTGFDV